MLTIRFISAFLYSNMTYLGGRRMGAATAPTHYNYLFNYWKITLFQPKEGCEEEESWKEVTKYVIRTKLSYVNMGGQYFF